MEEKEKTAWCWETPTILNHVYMSNTYYKIDDQSWLADLTPENSFPTTKAYGDIFFL